MMKKKTDNKNKVTQRLAVLPVLVILILGLSHKEFKAAPDDRQIREFSELNQVNEDLIAGDSVKKVKKDIIVVGYPASKSSGDTVKTRIKSNGSNIWTISKADDQKYTDATTGITEKSDDNVIQVIGYGMKIDGENFSGDSIRVRTTGNKHGAEPIYILDGTEIKSLDGVTPDEIESISVLKNESSTILYGEKGKNGVVIITSKKSGSPTTEALIILDGKETTLKVSDINPDDIQSINVLKGETALFKYGEKGKTGVIEITMKHPAGSNTATISSTKELLKHIASSILYPVKAQEAGQQGAVQIYAFVSELGEITQIAETRPKADVISIDEIVVVAYRAKPGRQPSINSSSVLNQEAALQVKKLPCLEIPEYKNKWIQFQFKFVLQ